MRRPRRWRVSLVGSTPWCCSITPGSRLSTLFSEQDDGTAPRCSNMLRVGAGLGRRTASGAAGNRPALHLAVREARCNGRMIPDLQAIGQHLRPGSASSGAVDDTPGRRAARRLEVGTPLDRSAGAGQAAMSASSVVDGPTHLARLRFQCRSASPRTGQPGHVRSEGGKEMASCAPASASSNRLWPRTTAYRSRLRPYRNVMSLQCLCTKRWRPRRRAQMLRGPRQWIGAHFGRWGDSRA